MTSKLQYYSDMLEQHTKQVTQSEESWASFLETAGRQYKYPFAEQLMIHAQRPDADACAPLKVWNHPMRQFVKRGSSGIALVADIGTKPRLHYVFNVADTEPMSLYAPRPYIWRMHEEHVEAVRDALYNAHGFPDDSLPGMIDKLATQRVMEYYSEYRQSIRNGVKESYLSELDVFSQRAIFQRAAAASAVFAVLSRCGLDTDRAKNNEDFEGVLNFNTIDSVYAFGGAVSAVSEGILREIEATVKNYERNKEREPEHERDYISSGRGLSDSRHFDGAGQAVGQVRPDAQTVPQEPSEPDVQHHVLPGDAVPTLPGDRGSGGEPSEHTDGRVRQEGSAPGQGGGSDGLGRPHEQPESAGGGNNTQRPDSQLNIELPEPADFARLTPEIAPQPVTESPAEDNVGSTAAQISIFDFPTESEQQRTILQGNTAKADNPEAEDNPISPAFSMDSAEEADKSSLSPQNSDNTPLLNFHITDDHLGEGGAKTKFGYNIDAILTLKQIENESRLANADEQAILSKYVGWGGLAKAFDGEDAGWRREYDTLRNLLMPDEYEMARASTLNAHYTSPAVIKAMYETVGRMGFIKGNILEPACGIGNFLGLLPESMSEGKLYGVELDSITGRIARQLYQKANITVDGYEKTHFPDSFFDLAIGNVPFGEYRVLDKRYDKHNFLIHDYFVAKTLDQVRPGGIITLITSKGTMDKRNPAVRKYIAQRAELLGAVRLPSDAFYKNAGTEVTTDILFLQKRDRIIDIEPDWVHLGLLPGGIPVNRYFSDHPEMILGTMAFDKSMYGNQTETSCHPIPGADLADRLHTALSNIEGHIEAIEANEIEGVRNASIPADPHVRNYSYTIIDNTLYFRENSAMFPVELSGAALDRVKGLTTLRDCVHGLIECQLDEGGDAEIRTRQAELNQLYDSFTARYGLINSTVNSRAYSNDSAYYLLCSLELLDDDGRLAGKADMFTKRTIKQKTVVTSVDTSSEALAVSISERAKVDLGFMASLTGFSKDKIVADLTGVIFRLPNQTDSNNEPVYVTSDDYLSGNVREKLRIAKDALKQSDSYAVNVRALEASQPPELSASEISVRLGATWVDKSYYEKFMHELLEFSWLYKGQCRVEFSPHTGQWNITNKKALPYNNVLNNITYGTSRANAMQILEETLNLKDMRIFDTKYDSEGKAIRVLNAEETTLARQKQDSIKQAFKDWVFKDPIRRRALVQTYNELFNSDRPREYDGSHLNFSGINPDIKLRPYQLNAIAHIIYGGNTLLAHEVGAGKTFEMIASCMESKRLGLCTKSLIAVPNHITEQTAAEFLRLYPSANILVATKKEFETANRRKFCAKIATGDYDAVIIGHSQLERIPMSVERQSRMLREQIDEIAEGIDELGNNRDERFTVKQLEKSKKNLEIRLSKLLDGSRKDSTVTFEQLGVDRLYIDEAHNFKNAFFYTKMRNIAGLSQTESQKATDLMMKCRYMDEITGGKGIIFATGTPLSNSMVEMFVMQRYLQYSTLEKKNLLHFDAWASTFGETTTGLELAAEGGYRSRTRFAKFHNLPELMKMFKEVADIKTADTLDIERPNAIYRTVVVKPSELQKQMVEDLSERAAEVHTGRVDPHVDNLLKITSDGRKIGLDQRLMNPLLPDFPGSKVNVCMENIYNVWRETAENRLTQLCFCDFSTPNSEGRFNVYDDIRSKLMQRGIPEQEIAFIHDFDTEIKKKELFAKMRSGNIRILFGSTPKLGTGANIQDRLIMLHDLDAPWRPSDLQQRAGRIERYGNLNPEVYILRYVTESTFDSYLYQTLESKQRFISQIMTSRSPARTCEDLDESVLSYAEIKALCSGNPLIKEKIDLDVEVARLRILKSDYQSKHYMLEDKLITEYPAAITSLRSDIAGYEKDAELHNAHQPLKREDFSPMEVMGVTYTEKAKAGEALLEACKHLTLGGSMEIGAYRGFSMSMYMNTLDKSITLTLKSNMRYTTDLGTDIHGNITRINNALSNIPDRVVNAQARLANVEEQIKAAKQELQKPFEFESQFQEKTARLALVESQLNINSGQSVEQIIDDGGKSESAEPESLAKKPSARAQLDAYSQDIKAEREFHVAERTAITRPEAEL